MGIRALYACLCLLGLALAMSTGTATSALYTRWSNTRLQGVVVFSKKVERVLHCAALCQAFGNECMVYTIRKHKRSIDCNITNNATVPVTETGFHSYTTSRYMDEQYVETQYIFPSLRGIWEKSDGRCKSANAYANLFRPSSRGEYQFVQNIINDKGISEKLWINLTHRNYPNDVYEIERHRREPENSCAFVEKDNDHIHYEECNKKYIQVCKIFP